MKIVKGSKYKEILKALEHTGGQCPCVPRYAWSNETLCKCKEFMEQETEGECHCKMWKKESIDETD